MKSGKNRFRIMINLIIVTFIINLGAACLFADQKEQVIKITAKKFEYSPNEIKLKKGVPVVLEFTSLDRLHGFNCPDLEIRTDIFPDKVSRIEFAPQKSGTFEFFCDIFCGEGHENMRGKIIVEE